MKTLTTSLWFIFWLTGMPAAHLAPVDLPVAFPRINLPETELWYVTLEMDFQTLFNHKKTNTYQPARFSFKDANGRLVVWDIKVRPRGRFRRMTCEFPPLKLKFPKQEMKAAGFGKHNEVKLVTHCGDDKKAREYLFCEYLTYQLYAKLTDVSLRTQLLQITYRDSNTGEEMITYGIFIEDSDALAERLNAEECKNCYGLLPDAFDQTNLQIHDLFQYMIGNTDWSVAMNRNMKIFTQEGGKKLIAPYDFDFSGLVNAGYAKPNPNLNQTNLRDRIYIGANWPEGEWANCFQLFKDKRQELMDTVDSQEFISSRTKKDIKKFLSGFYTELEAGLVPQSGVNN